MKDSKLSYFTPLQRYILIVASIRNGVILLSKKKILKAVLLVLSVPLTVVQNADGKEDLTEFDPDPDAYTEE